MRYAGAGMRLSCLPRARRDACGAARAPEFVGSVALLRSCATRERIRLSCQPRARRERALLSRIQARRELLVQDLLDVPRSLRAEALARDLLRFSHGNATNGFTNFRDSG
jgi:hypothetical protein